MSVAPARLPRVPDDWVVWAFTDVHGVRSGLVAALRAAGLIDARERWVAPPRTALVGCGDYVDRGGDIAGTLDLLRRLEREASAAGGVAHLARGNHEAMALMSRAGEPGWHAAWLEYGGVPTLEAFGCRGACLDDAARAMATIEAAEPGLLDWLAVRPHAVRWRDVLFVHGGLALFHAPADLGRTTEEHLWTRAGFYATAWESDAFEAYRRDGIGRVVFGHTPQLGGPRRYHDGRSLCIDTNAAGNPGQPPDAPRAFTLLGLAGDGSFETAHIISIDTTAAPDGLAR